MPHIKFEKHFEKVVFVNKSYYRNFKKIGDGEYGCKNSKLYIPSS